MYIQGNGQWDKAHVVLYIYGLDHDMNNAVYYYVVPNGHQMRQKAMKVVIRQL